MSSALLTLMPDAYAGKVSLYVSLLIARFGRSAPTPSAALTTVGSALPFAVTPRGNLPVMK